MLVSSISSTYQGSGSSRTNPTLLLWSISRSTRRQTLLQQRRLMVGALIIRIYNAHAIRCLGQVVVHSLSTNEHYSFDMKRPMRTVAMEPNFSKKGSRAFVCGGLSGALVMREKGWLGHKETTIHAGEGPIWQARWRGRLIAWANDNVSLNIMLFYKICLQLFRALKSTIPRRKCV